MSSLVKALPIVLAVASHPDDIEFMMAGTLLLLKKAGCQIHMWNLANGCLGSMTHEPGVLSQIRWEEARASAALAGASAHEPLFNDLEVFYDKSSLARVAGVLRRIRPEIILTHSLQDYMEDHQNVCRLVQTAAFSRGMPHFPTSPPVTPYQSDVRIYHAAPHGLRDGLERAFRPDFLVEISSVAETKKQMLERHRSQKDWLEASQGMGAYAEEMLQMGRETARMFDGAEMAEGWLRHSHLGFCPPEYDPLQDILLTLPIEKNTSIT